MNDINELAIILTARLDQLDAGLKDASDKLSNFSKESTKAAESGGTGFFEMAAKVYALGKTIVELTEHTILEASAVEAMNSALMVVSENLGMNTEEIIKNKQAVQELGYTDDAAVNVLLKLTKAHIDSKEAVNLARVALDYAAASGRSHTETLEMLGQAVLTGNARMLRQLGITASVSGAMSAYAATLGKTASELTDNERRQATLNVVMEHAADVAGAHEEKLKLSAGSAQQLGVAIQEAAEDIGGQYLSGLNESLKVLLKMVTAFNQLRGQHIDIWKSLGAKDTDSYEMGAWFDKLMKVGKFAPGAVNNPLPAGPSSTDPGISQKAKPEESMDRQKKSMDELIAAARVLKVTTKDFADDTLEDVFRKEKKIAELKGLSVTQQIETLKNLDKVYIMDANQRLILAQRIATMEYSVAKENNDKLMAMKMDVSKKVGDGLAQSFMALTGMFGKTAKDISQIWDQLIQEMIAKMIASGIASLLNDVLGGKKGEKSGKKGDFFSDLLGGALGVAGKFFGFDNPSNDVKAYSAGGKWFSDALHNFSKGYVNQALTPSSANVMGAATSASMGGGASYTIAPVFQTRNLMTSSYELRKMAIEAASVIKRSIGGAH